MILIGERINTGFADIKQAVMDQDPKPIQQWAREQAAAGATYIDEEVVRDGELITSRKPDDLPAFCRETVEALARG